MMLAMDSIILLCLFYLMSGHRIDARHLNYRNILEDLSRRYNVIDEQPDGILGVPRRPEHLPAAEPILPGHTLLRPAAGMLRSAVNYPHKESSLVYGNANNIGIKNRYGDYVLNTGFRRATPIKFMTNWLKSILKAAEKVDRDELHKKSTDILIFGVREPEYSYKKNVNERSIELSASAEEDSNLGAETFDIDLRRNNLRDRFYSNEKDKSETDSDEETDSRDYEKNPGNPFTIKKNRYKQNWLWNHVMDGDHMNIDPSGPKFQTGPSGSDFFFARKWWYFNQDDFIPF